jgi:hypothetical protein
VATPRQVETQSNNQRCPYHEPVLTALPLAALLLCQAPVPAEPPPVFDLVVTLEPPTAAELAGPIPFTAGDIPPPTGWRILRGPTDLAHLPTAAWIERPQVQRGKLRRWPAGKNQANLRLYPTPDVDQYQWRVVVYATNDLSTFRVASEAFRHIAIGASELFSIPPTGGETEAKLQLRPAIKVVPQFASGAAPDGSQFKFIFSYGPHGRPPRYARGDWDGKDALSIRLSPFAMHRPATLEMEWQSSPSAYVVGPEEFTLSHWSHKLPLKALPSIGTLTARLAAAAVWSPAIGYWDQEGDFAVFLPEAGPATDAVTLPALRYGEYYLLENNAALASAPPHRAHVELAAPQAEVELLRESKSKSFELQLNDWAPKNIDGVQCWVRAMWGPYLWQRVDVDLKLAKMDFDPVNEEEEAPADEMAGGSSTVRVELPSGDGFTYQVMAKSLAADGETTVYHWFGEATAEGHRLEFAVSPNYFEIDGYQDDVPYTLRLLRDPHGPGFPPKLWMDQPMEPVALEYMPLPFTNTLRVHGMPEGGYEATIWGLDRDSGEVEELSHHYPYSD